MCVREHEPGLGGWLPQQVTCYCHGGVHRDVSVLLVAFLSLPRALLRAAAAPALPLG